MSDLSDMPVRTDESSHYLPIHYEAQYLNRYALGGPKDFLEYFEMFGFYETFCSNFNKLAGLPSP